MSAAMRNVIVERQRPVMTAGPVREVYHLPDGKILSETDFQPIRCGGGIAFPSWPETVEYAMVCPDCKSATKGK